MKNLTNRNNNYLKAKTKKRYICYYAVIGVLVFAFIGSGSYSLFYKNRSSEVTKAEGNMTLFWSDEFNGTTLDASRWSPYHSTYGDGNNEEACLTPDNVTVGSGTLKITAKKEKISCPNKPQDDFSSGFIGSREAGGKYYPAFAKYEIRARLPHGQGLWPAFWLRHSAGSSTVEVDIMEYFHSQEPGKIFQTLHIPAELKYNLSKNIASFEAPVNGVGSWHTFAVDIVPLDGGTKARFDYYIDNQLTHSFTPDKFGWLNNYNKQAMFDIAINMAVGGNWVGHPDDELGWSRYLNHCIDAWPYTSSPCANDKGILRAEFPASYEVDYVRVYVPDEGSTPPPPPQEVQLGSIQNLIATAGNERVVLNWDAVPNANNYTVRWGQGGSWDFYSNGSGMGGNPTTNSYIVTGLINGQTYNFSVAARDSTGTYTNGIYSENVTASPKATATFSQGDINQDGKVDIVDLSTLLSNWGKTGSADINNDGKVDIVDLSILLSSWS